MTSAPLGCDGQRVHAAADPRQARSTRVGGMDAPLAHPADLAAEPASEAVRAWGRLGYPRRAQRLHGAAVAIVEQHRGKVPADYEALLALPGVGSYTAAAISVFAFGLRATVIDTNIRRVHARAVSGKALPSRSLTAAETRLAEALMPADTPTSCLWNAATMELGALVCTAKSPTCELCPVEDLCAWVAAGKPEADYTPKGQSWHGTDRQVRGAVMAVLRAAHEPVNRELILSAGVAAAGDTASPDFAFPANAPAAVHRSLKALYALSPPPSSCSAATRGCWRTLSPAKSRRAMQCSSRSSTRRRKAPRGSCGALLESPKA